MSETTGRVRSPVNRVSVPLTDADIEKSRQLEAESSASRVDIYRAGLEALARMDTAPRIELVKEIRANRPPQGRPRKVTADQDGDA